MPVSSGYHSRYEFPSDTPNVEPNNHLWLGWTMVQQGDKTGLVPSRIVAQSSNNQNQFILTGFFYWLFYVVEPISGEFPKVLETVDTGQSIVPSVFAGAGAAWFDTQNFYHSLIPMPILWGSINPLEKMVVLQLGGCEYTQIYFTRRE